MLPTYVNPANIRIFIHYFVANVLNKARFQIPQLLRKRTIRATKHF
jgi:hypothetical protein